MGWQLMRSASPEHADDLAAAWVAGAPDRAAWIRGIIGIEQPDGVGALNQAWAWFLSWMGHPDLPDPGPDPVYWENGAAGVVQPAHGRAIEGIAQLYELALVGVNPNATHFVWMRERQRTTHQAEKLPGLALFKGRKVDVFYSPLQVLRGMAVTSIEEGGDPGKLGEVFDYAASYFRAGG